MDLKQAAVARMAEAGGRLKVRSALNPILWLCGIITVPTLLTLPFLTNPPSWLMVLAFLPVVAAILGFIFLLIVDRDKLQSESFQLRKRELEIIQEKGGPITYVDSAIAIQDNATILIGEGSEVE
jgi:hypothetical protein